MTLYRRLTDQLRSDPDNDTLRRQRDREWQIEYTKYELLIHRLVSRYCPQGDIDYGDYLSAAHAGLERALCQSRSPVLFASFVATCIRNALIDYHIKRSKQLEREQLDETL